MAQRATHRLTGATQLSVPRLEREVRNSFPTLRIHTFTHYVNAAFFRGTSLPPVSRDVSEGKDTRDVDIRESEEIDAPALKALIRSAVALNSSGKTATPRKRTGR